MSVSLHSIQLVTSNIKNMVSFLTDVFDLEVDQNELGERQVKLNGTLLTLFEVKGYRPIPSISAFAIINVESKEDIKNYRDKYKFYIYRNSLNASEDLLDPDGRLWGFKISDQYCTDNASSIAVKHLS
jgi:hypothetical protein